MKIAASRSLRIGYLAQEPLSTLPPNLGHRVYIETLFRELIAAGHQVTLLNPEGPRVLRYTQPAIIATPANVALPLTGGRTFGMLEAPLRYVPRLFRAPSFGVFNNLRYAEACRVDLATCDVLHEHYG